MKLRKTKQDRQQRHDELLFRRLILSPRTFAFLAAAIVALIALAPFSETLARVGGGESYGGGGGSGDGGGDGEGIAFIIYLIFRVLIWLTIEYPAVGIPLDIIVVGTLFYYCFLRREKPMPPIVVPSTLGLASDASNGPSVTRRDGFAREFHHLRRFDPNFSEIIFNDFCYALYGRSHNARVRPKQLDLLSPYLSSNARAALTQRNPQNLQSVDGVIVGSMTVVGVSGLDTPLVRIAIEFKANYTEVAGVKDGANAMTWYVRERWELERKRDVLSPTPTQAVALHCPRCGAALEKDTNGACAFCGAKIESGEFQWYVRSIRLLSREERGPLLTSDVPEVGTDYPTVIQPHFRELRAEFEATHPEFVWSEFMARAALIFNELQAAWSSLDWERARPHETDNIFQMHRYWIEAYQRQGLRNLLDGCKITSMQPVRINEDAFYNAITLRIWAEGYDYKVDAKGRVVSGSKNSLRKWSEYWTFIRNKRAKPAHSQRALNCPNCGAALKVNVSGICEFCSGKITSGEFDWVLSKIEQDEEMQN